MRKTGAEIEEYTAAPIFMNNQNSSGAHEWLIEFRIPPNDLNYFTELLDNALKTINSDYEAKRYNNLVMQAPIISSLSKGTFYNWLKSKDKLGGQHKIRRLSNDRKFADEILALK